MGFTVTRDIFHRSVENIDNKGSIKGLEVNYKSGKHQFRIFDPANHFTYNEYFYGYSDQSMDKSPLEWLNANDYSGVYFLRIQYKVEGFKKWQPRDLYSDPRCQLFPDR